MSLSLEGSLFIYLWQGGVANTVGMVLSTWSLYVLPASAGVFQDFQFPPTVQ